MCYWVKSRNAKTQKNSANQINKPGKKKTATLGRVYFEVLELPKNTCREQNTIVGLLHYNIPHLFHI
jgi:hypothetical protein